MTIYELAMMYFSEWEINYARTQRQEYPVKVLARMANESLRSRACPKFLVETSNGKVKYFAGSVRTRKEHPDLEVSTTRLASVVLAMPRQLALDLQFGRRRRPAKQKPNTVTAV